MMESKKVFFLVLYLLLYSSYSTADLNPDLVKQVERGIDTSVKLLQSLDDLAKLIKKAEEGAKTIQKVLQVFDKLAHIASALSFTGALVSFIFAFIPQQNPTLEFMNVQFSEVSRKLDSLALQITSLAEEMEWTAYASIYSRDENNIKNSWTKLREFIDSATKAETEKEKTRLAEMFTTFYENTGTESSVHNFHSYLTENNPASLNKNLLVLVTQKSEGNFKTLVQFTAYFTSLMVTGLQLNLHYYALKGYDGKLKAEEAVKQLSNIHAKIQGVLIECTDSFEVWAEKDVQQIGTKPLPDNMHLAFSIKDHLDNKFNWYEWTIIVHDIKDGELTYGNSINVIAQNKVVIHLLHREKGFSVNEGIKAQIKQEWDSKGLICKEKISQWPLIFQSTPMKHVEYIHEPSDYAQTIDKGHLQLECTKESLPRPRFHISLTYERTRTFTVYLKSQKLVEYSPCSNVDCNKGECKQIKDTSTEICKCEKMFYGPTCQRSVQDDIHYAVKETKIIGISYQPVPDLTSIYYDLKEMKKYMEDVVNTLREDIKWTQIFIKYVDVIEKFRYLEKCHAFLKNETMPQDQFVSEVKALFTEGNTFLYMLHKFDLMMQGTGFVDESNILDILRKSLLTGDQCQTIACSKSYSERVDYFVRIMFAIEMEATLGWEKYRIIELELGNQVTPKGICFGFGNFISCTTSLESQLKNDMDPTPIYEEYISKQWSLFNRNGCGSLKAELLSNSYCEMPYHSTDQQEVPLTCQNEYRPFPETEKCSKGKWSALPVCYTHPEKGNATCKSENGTTVCTASCSTDWTFADGKTNDTYQCNKQPCPSFTPRACNRCTSDGACGYSEVCRNGECVDGCSVYSCGVNAQCSTKNHNRSCSCVSPWIPWKNEEPDTEGCRYKELQWMKLSFSDPIPENAVKSKTGYHVCRVRGPDGGWHGGWIWLHGVNTCNYEYGWHEKRADIFSVLVDPCGGSGVHWLSGGRHNDSVEIGQAVPWPWITYVVCSRKSNGVPGKLFNTKSGLKCHHGYGSEGQRDDSFYSLVKKQCIKTH